MHIAPGNTRTRHVCLSSSLACSGVNQCELCDEGIKQNVIAHALQRAGISLEQAHQFYLAYDEMFNWFHLQLQADPKITRDCSLDLSRVTIAPLAHAAPPPPPPVSHVHTGIAMPPPSGPAIPPGMPTEFEAQLKADPRLAQLALEQFDAAMRDPGFADFLRNTLPNLSAEQVNAATGDAMSEMIDVAPEPTSPAPPPARAARSARASAPEITSPTAPEKKRIRSLTAAIDADSIASAGIPIDEHELQRTSKRDRETEPEELESYPVDIVSDATRTESPTPSADHLNGTKPSEE